MTTPNVMNLATNSYGVNADSGEKEQVKQTKGDASFGVMLNQYHQNVSPAQSKEIPVVGTKQGAGSAEYAEKTSCQSRQDSIPEAQGESISDKIDSAQEEIGEFKEKTIATISRDLGVEEEDVKEALAVLGLTVFDLLNPQDLGTLVMQLSGSEDSTQLLTDPGFLNLMQDIGQLGSDLMNRLNLEMTQMNDLISQMDVLGEMEVLEQPETFEGVLQDVQEEVLTGAADMTSDAAENTQPVGQTVMTETDGIKKPEQEEEPEGILADDRQSEKEIAHEEGADGAKMDFSGEREESRTEFHGAVHPTPVGQDGMIFEQVTESAPAAESYTSVETLDMIRQITENVRTAVVNGTTTIEMQLNPENLGKVYLNLTSKEGTVNAQFTATNESVRAALEAQIADLRTNLNQAGVKVDAIEVTVASHEFEQNLEQNAQQEQRQGEQQEAASRRRRSITLDSLDELSGLMTEEEQLAAQIMRDNGNSMDIMA